VLRLLFMSTVTGDRDVITEADIAGVAEHGEPEFRVDPLAAMFDGAWLDNQQFRPLQYAVPGIIPEGQGILAAPPKIGKSWLACGIALACATGTTALGAIKVAKCPVLYLSLEDGPRRLQSRCRRIMCGEPIPAGIHFITKADPVQVVPMIGEFTRRHHDDKPLVIVDTLGKIRAGAGGSYQADYAMMGDLKTLIDKIPGATLLVVHHTRKARAADFIDSVMGSQGIAGAADFVLVLKRRRNASEAVLQVTGRDVREAEYALTVEDGVWALATTAASAGTGRLGDRALEILAFVNSRTQTTPADVTNQFALDPKRAGEVLGRLCGSGAIGKLNRGVYVPASAETAETAENAAAAACA
jgi:hypothetical protein